MRGNRFIRSVKMVVMFFIACIAFGYVVMRLWNWLVPSIFGLRPITYLQALGLLVLSKILLGGIHRHGGGGRRRDFKHRMERKFSRMSPEDRERFRAAMRDRCFGGRSWAARTGRESYAPQANKNEA